MKKTIFILALALSFFSCNDTQYFTNINGEYKWMRAPSSSPSEQYLAYRWQDRFRLAKSSPEGGLQAIKEVIAVKEVKAKDGTPLLAYKENDYEEEWVVMLPDGKEVLEEFLK